MNRGIGTIYSSVRDDSHRLTKGDQNLGSVTVLSQLIGSAQLLFFFGRITVLFEQQLGLPRRGYAVRPVDATRSRIAQLEDVCVVLPHPAMGDYRRVVVVVADDQVLGEAAVQTPSGLGEGLAYLLWGWVDKEQVATGVYRNS